MHGKMSIIYPNQSNQQSWLYVYPNYLPTNEYFGLADQLPLHCKPEIMVHGRVCHQQRDVLFLSDVSSGYRYSGNIAASEPLSNHPWLLNLLQQVNQSLSTDFNGILVNRYANGKEYIGAHSDDERGLSKSMVASISLGATRKLRIREKSTKNIVYEYFMDDRSLVIMGGNFQKDYTHEIPVESKIVDPRISLTFRHHTN